MLSCIRVGVNSCLRVIVARPIRPSDVVKAIGDHTVWRWRLTEILYSRALLCLLLGRLDNSLDPGVLVIALASDARLCGGDGEREERWREEVGSCY